MHQVAHVRHHRDIERVSLLNEPLGLSNERQRERTAVELRIGNDGDGERLGTNRDRPDHQGRQQQRHQREKRSHKTSR
jgi:hypothetical protein